MSKATPALALLAALLLSACGGGLGSAEPLDDPSGPAPGAADGGGDAAQAGAEDDSADADDSAGSDPSSGAAAIALLPLGDSITQGDARHASYRAPLWAALSGGGAFDFVGTQRRHHGGDYPHAAGFDPDHQGHWGWRADEVLAQLPRWVTQYRADIALIHLGTNDCLQRQAVEQTAAELEQIAALLRHHHPGIALLFAELGPSDWQEGAADACLRSLNAGLRELVGRLNQPTATAVLVPMRDALAPAGRLYDGLHPNAAGEAAMAEQWLRALRPLLGER